MLLDELGFSSYPTNNRLLARPDQELSTHISNMLSAYDKSRYIFLIENVPKFIISDLLKILIVFHDFGKISPVFQWKVLKKKKAPNHLRYLSYHTTSSALIIYFFVENYLEMNSTISSELQSYLKTNLFYSVINHHSPVLEDDISSNISDFNETRELIKVLKTIISLSSIDIIAYFERLLDIDGDFSGILEHSLERLYDLEYDFELELLINDLENKWDDSRKFGYFHGVMYHSLLIDLDEWDAKSQMNNRNQHWIEFDLKRSGIDSDIIDIYRESKFIIPRSLNSDCYKNLSDINKLRNNLFYVTNKSIDRINQLYIVNAPTGSAKTLAMLNMAIKLSNKYPKGIIPRIYYALPFISITEQVGDEIRQIFGIKNNKQNDLLTIHHHLASTEWGYFRDKSLSGTSGQEREETEFYGSSIHINLWHSEIIVTTFVSLWNSLITSKKRNLIRTHRLSNSIIIFDEVQGFPSKYWQLISESLDQLIKGYNCTVILGSATQPRELISFPTIDASKDLNKKILERINRYTIHYDPIDIQLSDFINEIVNNLQNRDTLIVVNTKKAARQIFNEIIKQKNPEYIYLLSTNVRPIDRSDLIVLIKSLLNNKLGVVLVATQVIEAGVDLSFEMVYRDFAPLDSIIQVAGRCNRNFEYTIGKIFIKHVIDGRALSSIYDKILLDETRNILSCKYLWTEPEISEQSSSFFSKISRSKIISTGHSEFINFEINSLDDKFDLIDDYPKETLILLEIDKFNELYSTLINKNNLKKMLQYALSLSKSDMKTVFDLKHGKIKEIVTDRKTGRKIYLLKLDTNDNIYQKIGGLNLVYNICE